MLGKFVNYVEEVVSGGFTPYCSHVCILASQSFVLMQEKCTEHCRTGNFHHGLIFVGTRNWQDLKRENLFTLNSKSAAYWAMKIDEKKNTKVMRLYAAMQLALVDHF